MELGCRYLFDGQLIIVATTAPELLGLLNAGIDQYLRNKEENRRRSEPLAYGLEVLKPNCNHLANQLQLQQLLLLCF